ncbi:hypothetical protein MPSEU_000243200 [Mayamaea pseudoterrestris]|nr:hypothetical protein MPSEU_000243200 [Mayamaea pseudoterrestris]
MRSQFLHAAQRARLRPQRLRRCNISGLHNCSSLTVHSSSVCPDRLQKDTSFPKSMSRSLSSSAALIPREETTPAAPSLSESQPFLPVDFETNSRIDGEESQTLTIQLQPGQGVRAESGAMIYMTESVDMNTQLLTGAMSRFLTGQSVFLTDYVCTDKPGTVCLGTNFWSKVIRLNLQDYGGSLICQRGAFLAGNAGINIEMEMTKSLTAGVFGGQGFILQRLVGDGDVFVKAGGTLVVKDLKDGEVLRVSSGSIVAFQRGIDYDVQMMKGIKNAMFGGEGLFITTLKGPGRVWLQGMPPDRMIAEIARRVPAGMGLGIPIGMGAGGGGSEAGEEGAGAGEDALAGSESVAATDAAIEADRHATVATSGLMGSEAVDGDSPEALFGDAAPTSSSGKDDAGMDDASFASRSSDPSFADDDTFSTPTQEPTYDDSDFINETANEGNEFSDGELFDDVDMSNGVDTSQSASDEGSSSIIGSLWDFFMGNGDD